MLYVNILTPDRVPEFFIPPKFTPQELARGMSSSAAQRGLRECHIAVPRSWGLLGPLPGSEDGHTDGDSTDWDPTSQAALSLPHFPRASTPYGFCRLLESPHTRRKESLFHNQGLPAGLTFPFTQLSAPGSAGSEPGISLKSPPVTPTRALSSLRTWGLKKTLGSSTRKEPRRHNSLPSSTDSSTDHRLRSVGAPFTAGIIALGHSLTKESTATLGDTGILRLRTEYCSGRQRVWLRLLSLEGLYERYTDCQTISCCLSLYLQPGKSQKQQTAIIRRSRNPIFNQDFFFFGIPEDQLHSKFFKIKVINKASRMKRGCVLGVCQLCLANILPM
ncbi:C2 calcium-dependent domain-containing protein 4A [Stegostoma tigrinum]|uniref:C2 calcium-dependent domain-containing protein 4A n=1 Tax=Stegostoma tigrinum TaxID=3053191 RepID=UPI00202B3F34|nr:C2 calcium-dependent domain-containing protein 4A [Stegostoma tigrinum]XP_048376826.1 C2 calcium-dependent domain-containing protein 4A [Stegostoma tigrinum]XP_048376827.1 C2 calcium-dependent domain-containing protein 4A [Stegostoma tigrinum]